MKQRKPCCHVMGKASRLSHQLWSPQALQNLPISHSIQAEHLPSPGPAQASLLFTCKGLLAVGPLRSLFPLHGHCSLLQSPPPQPPPPLHFTLCTCSSSPMGIVPCPKVLPLSTPFCTLHSTHLLPS